MTERSDQIKALSSESRLEILRLLVDPAKEFSHQESADPARVGVCMNMLAERMGVTQPTMSRHLDLLRRAGFLIILKRQKWSYCSRNEAALKEYHQWLSDSLSIHGAG